MKRILLWMVGFGLTTQMAVGQTTKSYAEYLSLGPIAGVGGNWVSNMNGSQMKPSGYLGIGLVYSRNPHWGYGTSLTVSSEGYKLMDMYNTSANVTATYLRMPMHVYYFFGDYKAKVRPKIYLGPTLGLKLAENEMTNIGDSYLAQNTGSFKSFDFGINAGAGLNVRLKKGLWLNMDIGYYQGLVDVIKDPANNYNVNQNLAFNAGLLWGIR